MPTCAGTPFRESAIYLNSARTKQVTTCLDMVFAYHIPVNLCSQCNKMEFLSSGESARIVFRATNGKHLFFSLNASLLVLSHICSQMQKKKMFVLFIWKFPACKTNFNIVPTRVDCQSFLNRVLSLGMNGVHGTQIVARE